MKPLIIVKLPDHCTSEHHEQTYEGLEHLKDDYNIIIHSQSEIKVYGLTINPIKYLLIRLKIWATLKIKKKK